MIKKPKKRLKKYEEEVFDTASKGWDTHTISLKRNLEGFDEAIDLCNKYLDEVKKHHALEVVDARIEELKKFISYNPEDTSGAFAGERISTLTRQREELKNEF